MPTQPLRVLVVSHAAVVPVNQEPFAALADDGADVSVIAPRQLSTDIRGRVRLEVLQGSKARVIPMEVVGGYMPGIGQRGIHLIVYRGLARAIATARADVIFVEEEPYSLAGLQVARAAGRTPFVFHENQNIARPLPPPFPWIRGFVMERAAGATVRNEAARELLVSLGFRKPVASFPHGVDPDRFTHPRERTDLPEPVVGFVGRLVEEKGIADLVDAVARLRARAGRGSLLVVGDGPARAQMEARAQHLGIPATFTGALAHDEVPSWYGTMDVVVIPSRTTRTWKEQFGRIVIEANAAGVPVIVSDSGELPHTVAATGGGVIVPEGDVEKLAEALIRYVEDPAWPLALAQAGKAAVARTFTPRAIARDLHRLLQQVAAS